MPTIEPAVPPTPPTEATGAPAGAAAAPPPPLRRSERLDPAVFQLPVERMRAGYYSDKYFVRTREVLQGQGVDPSVTMQLFQKRDAWVAGTDEAIAILRRPHR